MTIFFASRTWRAWTLIGAMGVASLGVACSKRDRPPLIAEGAEGVDTVLLAFLSQARALHHEANIKEDSGDLRGARESLARLLASKHGVGPEVDEVLADASARKAELEVRLGDLAAAEQSVAAGLSYAREPGYFRGHLLETSGLVEEARAKHFADAGKPIEADAARKKALKTLEEAIAMQASVIDRALGVDGGAGR